MTEVLPYPGNYSTTYKQTNIGSKNCCLRQAPDEVETDGWWAL